MKKTVTSVVALALAVCFVMVYILAYLAPTANAASSKSAAQTELNEVKEEKSSILQQAQDKEVEISELQQEINSLQFDIDSYSKKIEKSQKELDAAEKRENEQYAAMKLRLRVMYEDNNTTYINLVLGGESLTDVISDLEIIKQMAEYDQNMHSELSAIRTEIAQRKEELENEKAILDERKTTIVEKQQVIVAEKEKLDAMASQLNAEEAKLLEEIKKFEEEERKLQETIISSGSHSATSASAPVGSGKFGYPSTTTSVSSPYGYRIHPVYGTRKFHSGVDFPVGSGTPIFATADGKVISAGWNGGYGNTVILDHGGGITSLYAHNSSLVVSAGQTVTKGQVVSRAGSTGVSTGPHLHFEIRINGSTTDPMPYLR